MMGSKGAVAAFVLDTISEQPSHNEPEKMEEDIYESESYKTFHRFLVGMADMIAIISECKDRFRRRQECNMVNETDQINNSSDIHRSISQLSIASSTELELHKSISQISIVSSSPSITRGKGYISASSSIASDISYQSSFTDLIGAISIEKEPVAPGVDAIGEPSEESGGGSAVREGVSVETVLSKVSGLSASSTIPIHSVTSFMSIRNDSLRGMYARLSRLARRGTNDSYVSFGNPDDDEQGNWSINVSEDEGESPSPSNKNLEVETQEPTSYENAEVDIRNSVKISSSSKSHVVINEHLETGLSEVKATSTETAPPTPEGIELRPSDLFKYYSLETEGEGEFEMLYSSKVAASEAYRQSLLRASNASKKSPPPAPPATQALNDNDGILAYYQNLRQDKSIKTKNINNKFKLKEIQNLKLTTEFGLDPKLGSLLWQ